MKTGRTLSEMAAELERQHQTRHDFIAPTAKLMMTNDGTDQDVAIVGLNGGPVGLTEHAHGQLADDLEIPKRYYDRMRAAAPQLLAENVNAWLRKTPTKRLVRTLDGKVRGWLTDAYRPLDNFELAEAVLPTLMGFPTIRIDSCELTETRMYIKAVLPSLQMDLAMAKREAMMRAGIGLHTERPGSDVVQAAIVISNSEVGQGALSIDESIYTLICYNLAMVQKSVRKYHVGKRQGNGDGFDDSVRSLLSTEARQADDRAFFLKVRDVVAGSLTESRFQENALRMVATAGDRMIAPIDEVVEKVAERFTLADTTKKSLLQHLAEGGELTRYGLINAVTRTSQDLASYDEATELERLGGSIMNLDRAEWKALAA